MNILAMVMGVAATALVGQPDDIAGWQFVRSLPVGASPSGVAIVTAPEPVRDGMTALRFTVRPGDCSAGHNEGWNDCATNRERAELKQTDYQHQGETWWYGFSLYVPVGFRNIWPAKVAFAQFHQEGAKPALMFQNNKGGLWLDIHDSHGTVAKLPLIARQDLRGRWHDIVLNVHWSRGDDGLIVVAVDGGAAVRWLGPTMLARDVYFKFGLYRSHLDRNPPGAEATQTVYFDRIVRAAGQGKLEAFGKQKGPGN